MKTAELTREQIKYIYNTYMVNDFPEDELKPLAMMLKSLDEGIYECIGMEDEGMTVGYAYFLRTDGDWLLDYFAVIPERRGQGIGSEFLKQLEKYTNGADTVVIETENPEFAENEEERITRIRRHDFYLRNGYRDTGASALLFGVQYLLLEPAGKCHSPEQICEIYKTFYRRVLPADMFRKNVSVSLNASV